MERYCQPRGSQLWWTSIAKRSDREFISMIQKRITKLQDLHRLWKYSVWIFETRGGIHAHIMFVGDADGEIADALRRSKIFGDLIKVAPVTNSTKLVREYLAKETQEVPGNGPLLSAPKPVETAKGPWRQIARPPLTPSQFHCGTVLGTAMDDAMRIEARNRAALQATEQAAEQAEIEANGYFTEPEWQEIVSEDGVKCFVSRFKTHWAKESKLGSPPIPEDLSIPAFLERRTKQRQRP
jgi:hypothetical protein